MFTNLGLTLTLISDNDIQFTSVMKNLWKPGGVHQLHSTTSCNVLAERTFCAYLVATDDEGGKILLMQLRYAFQLIRDIDVEEKYQTQI